MSVPASLRSSLPLLLASLVLGACQLDSSPLETGSETREIVGGTTTSDYPAVAYLSMTLSTGEGFACSATLISPRVLVTAAHCLDNPAGATTAVSAYFGTRVSGQDSNFIEEIPASDWTFYSPWNLSGNDIALVLLESDSSVTPMPYNTQSLNGSDIGRLTHVIGWGNTSFEVGSGRKREMQTPITGFLNSSVMLYGTSAHNTCQGDSGGPGLVSFSGVERVTSITSYGLQGCLGESGATRVANYSSWIGNWIAQKDVPQPPELSFNTPLDGDNVRAGFQIFVEASDNTELVNVEIWVNNQRIADLLGRLPPFVITAPRLEDGDIKIEARAYDNRGDMSSRVIHVNLDSSCMGSQDCSGVMFCGDNGQCQAPNFDLGAVCEVGAECASHECATFGDEQKCTSACTPDDPSSCPENFSCLPVDDTSGLCWPGAGGGSDSGGCNTTGNSGEGGGAAALLLLGIALMNRRRRIAVTGFDRRCS